VQESQNLELKGARAIQAPQVLPISSVFYSHPPASLFDFFVCPFIRLVCLYFAILPASIEASLRFVLLYLVFKFFSQLLGFIVCSITNCSV